MLFACRRVKTHTGRQKYRCCVYNEPPNPMHENLSHFKLKTFWNRFRSQPTTRIYSVTSAAVSITIQWPGAWGGVVVKLLRYYSDGPDIDSWWCHWIFQWHISFRRYHGPGVDSAPNENEYQEHFLGEKAAGAWDWQPHHLHVPNVMEIWEP
jgi:hypothetical protein